MSKKVIYKGATLTRLIVPAPTDPTAPKTEEYLGSAFTGSVYLSDPLSLPQEAAYEESQAAAQIAAERTRGQAVAAIIQAFLPGILACVEKWDIRGLSEKPTVEDWPTHPKAEVLAFVMFLRAEIDKVYLDAVEDPNALPPQPMPTPAAMPQSPDRSISSTVLSAGA